MGGPLAAGMFSYLLSTSIINHSIENVSKSPGLASTMLLTNPIVILVVIVGAVFCTHGHDFLELGTCFLEANRCSALDC